jgi:hypothetical protein
MQDVEPISADILHTVAIAVAPSVAAPGPKNSRILPLPPETVGRPAMCRIMSKGSDQDSTTVCGPLAFDSPFVLVQPLRGPVSFTPIVFGHWSSHGKEVIASTASASPTPIPNMPKPPAFGVCESVPMINPPGLLKSARAPASIVLTTHNA